MIAEKKSPEASRSALKQFEVDLKYLMLPSVRNFHPRRPKITYSLPKLQYNDTDNTIIKCLFEGVFDIQFF